MSQKIYFFRQHYSSDCGPTCLRIILGYFGKYVQEWNIYDKVPCNSEGWGIEDFIKAAVIWGIKPDAKEVGIDDLKKLPLPIVLLSQGHYVVIYKIKNNYYYIADPQKGRMICNYNVMQDIFPQKELMVALTFTLTPIFEKSNTRKSNLATLFDFKKYFSSYKNGIIKVFLIILIVSLAQICLPFISRSVIDIGIGTSSWGFIKLLLIANVVLALTSILGNFIQTYLITHITNRVKISMLDDYIYKILSLPLLSFANSSIGNLLQRIRDNERIQTYLVNTLFSSLVSCLFMILFSCILLYFSPILFLVYIVCALLYMGWTCIFLSQRKSLDFKFWTILSQNNKYLIEIVEHILDIKGFNYFDKFRNRWRNNIIEQHQQNIRFLKFSQLQDIGGNIIIQGKDIALTYISCYYVLNGKITIGTLFAIQYILGNLNAPLYKLSDFLNQSQLFMISLNRIFEFSKQPNEVPDNKKLISYMPISKNISIMNVFFRYQDGTIGIRNFSIKILYGKKIGIVGPSGCGKSTFLKLLCGFIKPLSGDYFIGITNTQSLNSEEMRKHISFLFQENKLFEGSILENIVGETSNYNETKLIKSVEAADIRKEIEVLPDAYKTLIEGENKMMSKGQTQRILLARTLYKQADIYLFDEVANCLNVEMETKIVSRIDKLLSDKTRIFVTHRGEGLTNADLIVVMNEGMIVDFGTHQDLIKKESGYYHSLFSNKQDSYE
jgi:ATP-binding cassette, subfamily B, bacterial